MIRVEEGYIVFDNIPHASVPDDFEYAISLQSCSTPERILTWASHLSSKRWVSKRMRRSFVAIACREHGLDIQLPSA